MARSDDKRKVLVRRYAIVLALLISYFPFTRLTGLSISCPFRALTGYRCPGCGISSMFLALSEGEISEAFHCNQVLFFMIPLLVLAAVVKVIFLPEFLFPKSRFYRVSTIAAIVVLIVFGVLRNVFEF